MYVYYVCMFVCMYVYMYVCMKNGYYSLFLGKTVYFSLPRASDGTQSRKSSRPRALVARVYLVKIPTGNKDCFTLLLLRFSLCVTA